MALEMKYESHRISLFGPDLELTGDLEIDIKALEAAGYVAGAMVKVVPSTLNLDGVALKPIEDPAVDEVFGAIITVPGEFANSIGPSGSQRIAVAKALWVADLVGSGMGVLTGVKVGDPLYSDDHGLWTNVAVGPIRGTCLHVPSTSEPVLGIASAF